jgi:hypothetical protein
MKWIWTETRLNWWCSAKDRVSVTCHQEVTEGSKYAGRYSIPKVCSNILTKKLNYKPISIMKMK